MGDVEIARQVLASLSDAFVFQTSEPMMERTQPAQCTFRVAYGSQLSRRKLVSLLSAIPGARVRLDPDVWEGESWQSGGFYASRGGW